MDWKECCKAIRKNKLPKALRCLCNEEFMGAYKACSECQENCAQCEAAGKDNLVPDNQSQLGDCLGGSPRAYGGNHNTFAWLL